MKHETQMADGSVILPEKNLDREIVTICLVISIVSKEHFKRFFLNLNGLKSFFHTFSHFNFKI